MAVRGRPFPKGVSGNPGGRPVGSAKELAELCRKHGPDAIAALVDVVQNGDGSERVAAAKVLLDRGYGKEPATIALTGAEGGPIDVRELSTQALEQIVARGLTSTTLPK